MEADLGSAFRLTVTDTNGTSQVSVLSNEGTAAHMEASGAQWRRRASARTVSAQHSVSSFNTGPWLQPPALYKIHSHDGLFVLQLNAVVWRRGPTHARGVRYVNDSHILERETIFGPFLQHKPPNLRPNALPPSAGAVIGRGGAQPPTAAPALAGADGGAHSPRSGQGRSSEDPT